MLGLIMILCAIIIMYKVADSEGRSGVLWGAATFALCFLSMMFIPEARDNSGAIRTSISAKVGKLANWSLAHVVETI